LSRSGAISGKEVAQAIRDLDYDSEKQNPLYA
jgi:hypothetical protein